MHAGRQRGVGRFQPAKDVRGLDDRESGKLTATVSRGPPFSAVAIASGGLDSSTLLYKLCHDGEQVSALTFLYGQRHEREVRSAKAVCGILGVDHKVIDLSNLKGLLSSSAL